MKNIALGQRQTLKLALKFNLKNRIELSETIQCEEKKILQKIQELENSPLFKELAGYGGTKIVSIKKCHFSTVTKGLLELNEHAIKDTSVIDIESFIKEKEVIMPLVKKIGENNFCRYFLFTEYKNAISDETIAGDCGINKTEVEKIRNFVNEFCIQTEFYQEETQLPVRLNYQCIGQILQEADSFYIKYLSLNFARGRYIVDYAKFEKLIENNVFVREKFKEIRELLKQIELINTRKSVLQEIFRAIIEVQAQYLKTGDILKLVSMSQKELSGRLKVHPSIINRALTGRSAILPWKEEISLKELFPSRKMVVSRLVKKIISEQKIRPADETVKKLLSEKYKITISRRSIADYRKP
ncbi:MAG: hypothetical protein A3J83_00765 [Elusimicrobia bacterium RIFOXYA2_FULL_40_6]|nr:MAG: hypothetical protein A3J83_00765 [Elusimicrobia bacterium RIFOXYA2_FULL_40_6]